MKSLALLLFIFIYSTSAPAAEGKITYTKKTIKFSNGAKLKVEMAVTHEQKANGLMNRTTLPEGEGMLFIFLTEQPLSFWMKNTLIPLTIGYFDKNKKLIETHDMTPVLGPVLDSQLLHYPSSRPAMFAIEVPPGWFARKKIKTNDSFSIIH